MLPLNKKKKKFYFFFCNTAYNKRNFLKFNLEDFEEKYILKIVDFTRILFPSFNQYKQKVFYKKKILHIKNYQDLAILYEELKKNKKNFIVDLTFHADFYKEFFNNFKYNVTSLKNTISFIFNLGPFREYQYNFAITKTYLYLKKKIFNFFKKNITYSYFLVSGTKYLNIVSYKNLIPSQSFDFIKTRKKSYLISKLPKERYVVFIDIFFGKNNVDFFFNKDLNKINLKNYFKSVNYLLHYIKGQLKSKIFLAAHYKSNINYLKNYKSCDRFFYDKTDELVNKAQYVILTASTAVSYAIIFNKPLIYLYLDNNLIIKKRTHTLWKSTGGFRLFENKFLSLNKNDLKVDKNKYKKYLDSFIKYPGSSNKNFFKLIDEKIRFHSAIK